MNGPALLPAGALTALTRSLAACACTNCSFAWQPVAGTQFVTLSSADGTVQLYEREGLLFGRCATDAPLGPGWSQLFWFDDQGYLRLSSGPLMPSPNDLYFALDPADAPRPYAIATAPGLNSLQLIGSAAANAACGGAGSLAGSVAAGRPVALGSASGAAAAIWGKARTQGACGFAPGVQLAISAFRA